jgi:hypothetical protein
MEIHVKISITQKLTYVNDDGDIFMHFNALISVNIGEYRKQNLERSNIDLTP